MYMQVAHRHYLSLRSVKSIMSTIHKRQTYWRDHGLTLFQGHATLPYHTEHIQPLFNLMQDRMSQLIHVFIQNVPTGLPVTSFNFLFTVNTEIDSRSVNPLDLFGHDSNYDS